MSSAGLVVASIFLLAAMALWLCDAHLVYSLDDPYISLAFGWNIGRGHYGIHFSEFAPPSSSILYPFLLAVFARASFQDWIPLVINSIAAAGTAGLFVTMYTRHAGSMGSGERRWVVFLTFMLCLGLNVIGIVFTGLEHSLHIVASVAVVYGLARTLDDDAIPGWLLPAIVLLPLLRFEGLALALLVLLAPLLVGKWRTAVMGLVWIAACLTAGRDALVGIVCAAQLRPGQIRRVATQSTRHRADTAAPLVRDPDPIAA